MKVAIGCDHGGFQLKEEIIKFLSGEGYEYKDVGTYDENSVDYPDIAATLADAMADDEKSRGIIICGTGAGVMIAANRYRHIRASRCDRPDQARDDRFHDDTNVLALAADDIDIEMAFLCTQAFLESPFDAIERRIRRIEKIS